jgi:SAM-dependent methyltransferase
LRKGLELDKNIAASANLISYVIGEYPDYFCGRKKGVEILFAQDKIALWNEYFSNNNSGYAAYNSLGAFGVLRWAMHQENIKLLEVGGGTAGGTCALLDKLKERQLLSRVSEYIFSDLSPIFLRLGNQAIMQKVPEDFAYSLKKLDFDKPLIAQGIKENDLGVVYGVNAIHVAKNLVVTLKNIYRVLKPGGMLIFSEYCRPQQDYLLFQEFIFCLLDNYVEVELDGALRPNPGFLDFAHWRGNLEAAGFKNIEAIFNTDGDYPDGLGRETGVLAAVIKAEK